MPAPKCFVCGGTVFTPAARDYRRCTGCGHEELAGAPEQAFMVNDILTLATHQRPSQLDRFQIAVTRRWAKANGCLVDVGSGSGRFLRFVGRDYRAAYGVEITAEAVNFSRNALGLNIVADISEITAAVDIVTAWHSLEHFPPDALDQVLARIAAQLAPQGRVIVSVPNAASFQYRIFGTRYAFYDAPHHLHQFTPTSLGRLFARHGLVRCDAVISWPYNLFGYAQALLNCLVRPHNYFYYRMKRGRAVRPGADLASIALLPMALPLALAGALADAARPARQGVLTWCFQKRG